MRYLSVDPRLGPSVLKEFSDPEMTKEAFLSLANKFRSPHLWLQTELGWKLRHQVT